MSDTVRHPVGEAPRLRADDGVPHRFEDGFPCGALRPQAVKSRSLPRALLLAAALSATVALAAAPETRAPRRPQALALLAGSSAGEVLLTGNRSGSVSVIRTRDLALLGEVAVGGDLTDLEAHRGWVVAVDHAGDSLLPLGPAPAPVPALSGAALLEVGAPVPTCRDPLRVALRGETLAVSCLWAREVRIHESEPPFRPAAVASLPFEPQELLFLDDRTLLAADAFGGGLALISAPDGEVLRTLETARHNLHGLALLSGSGRVAIAHQELHSGMHTTSDDIRWGVFITNSVSLFPLDDLVSGNPRLERRTRVLDLGDVLTPSGDPAAILTGPDGRLVVALAGVSRLAVGSADARRLSHLRVGRGPSALAAGGDGRIYAANTWSDSVSVISPDARAEIARVQLGPAAPLTPADRGELLFHDAGLSLRGWMSCASCHTRGHTNHRLADTLGDGNYGAPKRVPSLLGVRETKPWGWDGRIRRLEEQVAASVRTTLRGRDLTAAEAEDLAAYLRALELPEAGAPERPARTGAATDRIAKGREAFARYSCDRCHRAPLYTSPGVHRVGLTDELGNERFNAPSLRGVRLRRRLLHDGSARSLEEVFEVHPGIGPPVEPGDLEALIAFLRTL